MINQIPTYIHHQENAGRCPQWFIHCCYCGTGRSDMMTSSNGNIFRATSHLCGEFTGSGDFPTQRPVTRSFDVFFDLCLNKRLNKQPWGWWFETPSWSLWRQCNAQFFSRVPARYLHPAFRTVCTCNKFSFIYIYFFIGKYCVFHCTCTHFYQTCVIG